MAERILKLHLFGVQTELAHIPDSASVELEFSDPTDEDPIEWVNVHVRSSEMPTFAETHAVDVANDNTPGNDQTVREMKPRAEAQGGPAAEPEAEEEIVEISFPIADPPDAVLALRSDEVTKAELVQLLRDKDMPVSGTKQELLDRLNEAS